MRQIHAHVLARHGRATARVEIWGRGTILAVFGTSRSGPLRAQVHRHGGTSSSDDVGNLRGRDDGRARGGEHGSAPTP